MHGLDVKLSQIHLILDSDTWEKHQIYTQYYIAKEKELVYNKNTQSILYGSRDYLGYIKFSIHYNDKKTHKFFHRLKWETYNKKDIPDGYEIDHIDNDCRNNNLENLQLLSKSEHCKKTRTINPNINISKDRRISGYATKEGCETIYFDSCPPKTR